MFLSRNKRWRLERLRSRFINILDQQTGRTKKILRKNINVIERRLDVPGYKYRDKR